MEGEEGNHREVLGGTEKVEGEEDFYQEEEDFHQEEGVEGDPLLDERQRCWMKPD